MKDFNIQYPPQTGFYSVKVKNGKAWSSKQIARLQISVGQSYHENDKLAATIEWAKHRYGSVIICVNDTLQRYNHVYNDGLTLTEANNYAENAGREWIERNIGIIRSLPNYKIYRWNHWTSKPNFSQEHKLICEKYKRNPFMKELVHKDIETFWSRRNKNENLTADFSAFQSLSVDYLLEEIAAFNLMFHQDDAVDVYPGSTLLPCLLEGKPFARIDFNRNGV